MNGHRNPSGLVTVSMIAGISTIVSLPASAACVNPSDGTSLGGLFDGSAVVGMPQNPFDSSGSIDFERLLDGGCAGKIDFSSIQQEQYWGAIRTGVGVNLFLDLIDQRSVARLVDLSGLDKQIVEPDAAVSSFGSGFDAQEWRSRVSAAYPKVRENKSACQLAIEALKGVACASENDSQCDIERSYESRCASSTDRHELGACIVAADNYFAECFGNEAAPEQAKRSMVAACDAGKNYCSSGLATDQNSDDIQVLVTATHCTERSSPFSLLVREEHCIQWRGEWGPDDVGEATMYEASQMAADADRTPLQIGEPRLFAQTYLGGVSFLAQLRNRAAEKYNEGGENVDSMPSSFPLYSDIVWDASALCTIVELSGSQLKHTCQSSRGTSGGPLIQILDERILLVGLNLGSLNATSGAFNIGRGLSDLLGNLRP